MINGVMSPQNGSQQSSPSLNEVRTSIKEVTSAIVHYVSGTRESSDRLSPSLRLYADSSSRFVDFFFFIVAFSALFFFVDGGMEKLGLEVVCEIYLILFVNSIFSS